MFNTYYDNGSYIISGFILSVMDPNVVANIRKLFPVTVLCLPAASNDKYASLSILYASAYVAGRGRHAGSVSDAL